MNKIKLIEYIKSLEKITGKKVIFESNNKEILLAEKIAGRFKSNIVSNTCHVFLGNKIEFLLSFNRNQLSLKENSTIEYEIEWIKSFIDADVIYKGKRNKNYYFKITADI